MLDPDRDLLHGDMAVSEQTGAKEDESAPPVLYRLSQADCIESVGGNWDLFALANDAGHLAGHEVIGSEIWDHVEGDDVRHLFRTLFEHVRRSRLSVEIPFRCDSPRVLRFMELKIEPGESGSLSLTSRTKALRTRARSERPSMSLRPRTGLLRMCSWCKRIAAADGAWTDIQDLLQAEDLLGRTGGLGISHGICTACRSVVEV